MLEQSVPQPSFDPSTSEAQLITVTAEASAHVLITLTAQGHVS